MRIIIIYIILLSILCLGVLAQEQKVINYNDLNLISQSKIDSMFFSRIPFDSTVALKDLNNGIIKIIHLYRSGDTYLDNEEFEIIERRFGFKYESHEIQNTPSKYLIIRQTTYNDIIYSYLDSVHQIDSRKEIITELQRLTHEKYLVYNQTNWQNKRKIRKATFFEKRNIRKQILIADILYRERKFNEALSIYDSINFNKKATNKYILNSKYHCLQNLGLYREASILYEENSILINKTKK